MRLGTEALFLAATSLFVVSAAALGGLGTIFVEIEPNDDKAQANEVELFGSANVTELTGTGNLSGPDRDYFLLSTPPSTTGQPQLRRYRLTTDYISQPERSFLRGLAQTTAGIQLGSDAPVQSSKFEGLTELAWYGFGKGEKLYFDVGDLDFFRFQYEVDAFL